MNTSAWSHLDRDARVPVVLQELLRVERDDARLIRLRDVGEDGVDDADDHRVLLRMASVVDDGHDVGALLRHVQQVTARAMREFHRVDDAFLKEES